MSLFEAEAPEGTRLETVDVLRPVPSPSRFCLPPQSLGQIVDQSRLKPIDLDVVGLSGLSPRHQTGKASGEDGSDQLEAQRGT